MRFEECGKSDQESSGRFHQNGGLDERERQKTVKDGPQVELGTNNILISKSKLDKGQPSSK